jgi:hypothetical protein
MSLRCRPAAASDGVGNGQEIEGRHDARKLSCSLLRQPGPGTAGGVAHPRVISDELEPELKYVATAVRARRTCADS